MAEPQKKQITPEEYFEMEASSEYKSEYFNGEIFAMTGASFNHNVIATNVLTEIHSALKDTDCFVLSGDMKIQADTDRHYVYPDISIVCGEIDFVDGRNDTVKNPVALIEILSESTRDYDRGSKFTSYRNIASLKDYILIDQYHYHVEYFYKNESGQWTLDELKSLPETFVIRSVGVNLTLEAIYHRVTL